MRSLYRERRWECGDYLEVEYYPVYRPAGKRRKKFRPTSEVQARLNDRSARRALVRILNTNFTEKDLEIHLLYRDECLPLTDEDAAKDIRNYLRRVKRLFEKAGLDAPKYVYITEGGDGKRYHHHLTISGGIGRDVLEKAWKCGFANSRRLQFSENGIEGLAHYITKQFRDEGGRCAMRKHFVGSKNLVHPVPKDRDGAVSRKKVVELATVDAGNRSAFEELCPGYFYFEQETVFNEVNGGVYLSVKLYRDQRKRGRLRE